MWCWTDGCLLSRLQRRGNVVPAWIVIIPHWKTVYSVATVPASLPAFLPVILSRRVLDKVNSSRDELVVCQTDRIFQDLCLFLEIFRVCRNPDSSVT